MEEEYSLPSGLASMSTTGGLLATVEYSYPLKKKDVESALKEALRELQIMSEQLSVQENLRKEELIEIARYHTAKVRRLGYSKWGTGHVIDDLKKRSERGD